MLLSKRILLLGAVALFTLAPKTIAAQTAPKPRKLNGLKIDAFSFLNNHVIISAERLVKRHRSFELSLGLIGFGRQYKSSIDTFGTSYSANGFFLRAGYKCILKKGWNSGLHPLGGTYIKYELGYTRFDEHYSGADWKLQYFDERRTIQALSLMFVAGQQFVIRDFLLLNFYGGVGSIFDNRPYDFQYDYPLNNYVATHLDHPLRLGVTGGISAGIAF